MNGLSMQPFRAQCAAVDGAIERELKAQTPPNGNASPHYHCPGCEQQRERRGEMRSHMQICEPYRDYVVASLRRADLTPALVS